MNVEPDFGDMLRESGAKFSELFTRGAQGAFYDVEVHPTFSEAPHSTLRSSTLHPIINFSKNQIASG